MNFSKFIENKQVVSVHEDTDNISSCSVGIIIDESESFIVLKSLSHEGLAAGYEVILKSAICLIDYDGLYEKKIEFLYQSREIIFQDRNLDFKNEKNSTSFISNILHVANANQLAVVIWLDDVSDSIIGLVKSFQDKNNVEIKQLDDYGREDGYRLLKIKEIRRLDINSKKAQIILFLHNANFSLAPSVPRRH